MLMGFTNEKTQLGGPTFSMSPQPGLPCPELPEAAAKWRAKCYAATGGTAGEV